MEKIAKRCALFATVMELFLFRHAEYERLYNCTGLDIDSIPLERRQFYEQWLHRVHNIAVAFLGPFIYLIFAAKLFYDVRMNRRQFGVVLSEMGSVQIRIFAQVLLVSLINTFSGFLYVYMQSNEVNQWLITFAEFAWLHVHESPYRPHWRGYYSSTPGERNFAHLTSNNQMLKLSVFRDGRTY
uniref:Anoctamin n=1 Tax=Globodera pallida TaxID=36090 RepID=A0A183CHL9_GLOPA